MSKQVQPSFFDHAPPASVRAIIEARIAALRAGNKLSLEDEAVLQFLEGFWESRAVTQREIARSERWLGCHPTHETDVVENKMETTTRRVRSIIRHLKIEHKIPILGGTQGYYLPTSTDDAEEYLESMEAKHKAMAKSLMVTYHAMREALNLRSDYFENIPVPDGPEEEDDLPAEAYLNPQDDPRR